MKYYKLLKNKGKLIEINKEDIKFNIKPAKIYSTKSAYYGVGGTAQKGLLIIEKAQRSKMNKNIEGYWDRVANNWIEKLKKENVNLPQ